MPRLPKPNFAWIILGILAGVWLILVASIVALIEGGQYGGLLVLLPLAYMIARAIQAGYQSEQRRQQDEQEATRKTQEYETKAKAFEEQRRRELAEQQALLEAQERATAARQATKQTLIARHQQSLQDIFAGRRRRR